MVPINGECVSSGTVQAPCGPHPVVGRVALARHQGRNGRGTSVCLSAYDGELCTHKKKN